MGRRYLPGYGHRPITRQTIKQILRFVRFSVDPPTRVPFRTWLARAFAAIVCGIISCRYLRGFFLVAWCCSSFRQERSRVKAICGMSLDALLVTYRVASRPFASGALGLLWARSFNLIESARRVPDSQPCLFVLNALCPGPSAIDCDVRGIVAIQFTTVP